MSSTGTLVGMPAVKGRELDPFQPGRWSHPPANDLAPIVPCDEPDDENELLSPWRALRAIQEPTPLPRLPRRRVMPEEERRLLERAAIIGVVLVAIIVALVALSARLAH